MDYEKIKNLSYTELKNIASRMYLPKSKSKDECIKNIIDAFKEYEQHKKKNIDKYTRMEQLGLPGKEGIVYKVVTKGKKEYAMKTFKLTKSSKTIRLEAETQKVAAKCGISPKVISVDTVDNNIVMEKLDKTLLESIIDKNGKITKVVQEAILDIILELDKCGIFHGDPNPLNFMFDKKGKLYIIDFGYAKHIDEKLKKKLNTSQPNRVYMLPGIILKLRELFPDASYKTLMKPLSESEKEMYKIF